MSAGEEHELLVELIKDPAVARKLLQSAEDDYDVEELAWREEASEGKTSTEDTALSRVKIYHPDVVMRFTGGKESFAVAFEVQTSTNDPKRASWVYYPGRLYMEHDCDVQTYVVTVDPSIHRWAKRQHDKIPDRFKGLVVIVDPSAIPSALTEEQVLAHPRLALFNIVNWAGSRHEVETPMVQLGRLATAKAPLLKTDSAAEALWGIVLERYFTLEEIMEYINTEDNEVRRNAVLDYVRVEYAEELGEKDAEVQRWRTEFRRAHAASKAEIAASKAELAASKAEIAASKAELAASKEEIAASKEEIAARDVQLSEKDAELALVARTLVESVAAARGWKLSEAQLAALDGAETEALVAMSKRAAHAAELAQIFEGS